MNLGEELTPNTACGSARGATPEVSLFEENNLETGNPRQVVGDTTTNDASTDDADVCPLWHAAPLPHPPM